MPDHVHWLFRLVDQESVTEAVQSVKSVSSHAINKLLKRRGRIWQPGFHDRTIRTDEDLRQVSRYIVENPLRAGLVGSLSDYSFWDAAWVGDIRVF